MNKKPENSEFELIPFPQVSVVMCAYNAAPYIAAAIDSILQQTCGETLELIVVDDGSTDGTSAILNAIQDNRLIVLRLALNQGLIAARNFAIKHARGYYIAIMDADDIAFPNRLEQQIAHMRNLGADVCASRFEELNQHRNYIRRSRNYCRDPDLRALLTVYSPLCNSTVVVIGAILRQHPYQIEYQLAEDYALWCQLAAKGYRFTTCNEILLSYRVHEKQISQTHQTALKNSFAKAQSEYVKVILGLDIIPKPIELVRRLQWGWLFMWRLNHRIPGISLAANYEIYARFQPKARGIWRIATPFLRLERFLVALSATLLSSCRNMMINN